MKYLFVCSRNEWRSRTAETLFKNNGHHQVRSAGTRTTARIRINQQLIDWADIIFVMEPTHRTHLLQAFTVENAKARIVVLDITDDYTYMDAELVEMLKAELESYFATPENL